jgi:hypothetical protein
MCLLTLYFSLQDFHENSYGRYAIRGKSGPLIVRRFREVEKSGRHLRHHVRQSVASHGKTLFPLKGVFHEILSLVIL